MGLGVPKAWALVNGKPLIWLAVQRLREAGVDDVYVAVGAAELAQARQLLAGLATVVVGGPDRLASVRAALTAALSPTAAVCDPDVILVHDAARAFVPVAAVRRVIDAIRGGASAVIPVLPVVDTIRSVDPTGHVGAVVNRERLRIVQTPQGFTADVLRRAHDAAESSDVGSRDDAGLAEAIGAQVTVVAGDADAFNIVTPLDLEHARRLFG